MMLQIIFCQGKILIGKVSGHFPYSLKRNVRTKGQNARLCPIAGHYFKHWHTCMFHAYKYKLMHASAREDTRYTRMHTVYNVTKSVCESGLYYILIIQARGMFLLIYFYLCFVGEKRKYVLYLVDMKVCRKDFCFNWFVWKV